MADQTDVPADPGQRDEVVAAGSDELTAEQWWRRPPSWRRVVAAVTIVLLGYYAVTLVQVVNAGRQHGAGQAEAIVVLGAAQYDGRPSAQLAARLDHALALWEQGVAPYVMVTGGKLPGDRFTEAEASAAYLQERGVPATALLSENAGSTTYESLDSAADQLVALGFDEVVLVTDPYHSFRSKLIAEEVGLDPSVSSTPDSVVTGWSNARRHLLEAGGVAVGRLVGFDRLSDLTD